MAREGVNPQFFLYAVALLFGVYIFVSMLIFFTLYMIKFNGDDRLFNE